MRTRSVMVVAASAAAITVLTAAASGSVILSDDFNGRTNGSGTAPHVSDWGSNNNALGGSVVQTYEVSNPFTSGGSTTVARVQNGYGELGWAFAEIQHDFAANVGAGGLRWDFKVNFPGTAGGHVSWWLGSASSDIVPGDITVAPDQIPLQKPETDIGIIMRANPGSTGWTLTNKGTIPNGGTEINFLPSVLAARGQDNTVVLELFTTSATLSSPATLRVTVNGIVQDVNGAAPGTDYSFTWDAQGELYGGFGSNINNYYLVDDLVVTAIPEPGALGAMAAGLVLLKRRRTA
jgi:hypothetical protein